MSGGRAALPNAESDPSAALHLAISKIAGSTGDDTGFTIVSGYGVVQPTEGLESPLSCRKRRNRTPRPAPDCRHDSFS